jgi:ligand-binding sensor domain-containing protein
VGSGQFLDRFDPVTETFIHYRFDTTHPKGETVPVIHISQDRAGALWLSTVRGLYRFDPK